MRQRPARLIFTAIRNLGTDIADTSDPVPAAHRNYTYDPIGNRIQAAEGDLTRDYTPNALNQYSLITANNGILFILYGTSILKALKGIRVKLRANLISETLIW